ncbi:MAG: hypothetical protein IJW82_04780 [Clostridia bacterium]|nr:hypothetical protein [Clostridia bacterium]
MKTFKEYICEIEPDFKDYGFLKKLTIKRNLKKEYKNYIREFTKRYNNFIETVSSKEFSRLNNELEKIHLLVYVLYNCSSGSNLFTLFTQDLYSYGVRDFEWYKILKGTVSNELYNLLSRSWQEFLEIESIKDFEVLNDYIILNDDFLVKLEDEYDEQFVCFEEELFSLLEKFSQE